MTVKNHEVQVQSEETENLLKLSFEGQTEPVRWQVQFRPVVR